MSKTLHSHSFLSRFARSGLFCLLLLVGGAALAEPRPETYGAVPDHYAEVREALQASRWSNALEALQRLSRQMPSVTDEAEFHNLMGFSLRQLAPGNLRRAIDHYHRALSLDPGHVQAREYLGQAFLMQGRPDLAREQLKFIERLCKGKGCKEWGELDRAIQAYLKRP